jgi:hypothetical protein
MNLQVHVSIASWPIYTASTHSVSWPFTKRTPVPNPTHRNAMVCQYGPLCHTSIRHIQPLPLVRQNCPHQVHVVDLSAARINGFE